jgi:hypothetical protein
MIEKSALINKAMPYLRVDSKDCNDENYFNKTNREIMGLVLNAARSDSNDMSKYSDDYLKGGFESVTNLEQKPRQHMDSKGAVFNVISAKNTDSGSGASSSATLSKLMRASFNESQHGGK